jgi:hypothetical protein
MKRLTVNQRFAVSVPFTTLGYSFLLLRIDIVRGCILRFLRGKPEDRAGNYDVKYKRRSAHYKPNISSAMCSCRLS